MAGIVNVMGVPVNIIKESEYIALMKSYIGDDVMNVVYMVTVDTFKELGLNPELLDDIKAADLVLPGEKAVMSSSHGRRIKGIVNSYKYFLYMLRMPELFKKICIIGNDVKTTMELTELFKSQNPNIEICGSYALDSGYNDETVINDINSREPDLIIMTVGSPRLEKWVMEHRSKIYAKVCVGIGNIADVMLKQNKKAPGWMIKLGLAEFFYDVKSRNHADNKKKERIMQELIANNNQS